MALPKSGIIIPRRSIAGMEGMWAKMWDPPTESPDHAGVAGPHQSRAGIYGVPLA